MYNKNTVFITLILMAIASMGVAYSQNEVQYSSNMFNLHTVNPAAVGLTDEMHVAGVVRSNLKGVGPQSYNFGIDGQLQGVKRKHGFGLALLGDEAGLLKTTNVNVSYAHKQKLWNGELGVGVMAGIVNGVFSGGDVNDPHDEYGGYTSEYSDIKFDLGVGFMYSSSVREYGISLSHITRPEIDIIDAGTYLYYNRSLSISGQESFKLRAYPGVVLKPSFFLKTDGVITQLDLNCNAWYQDKIYFGASYRVQEAIVFLGGYEMPSGILVGVAYDVPTSKMRYNGSRSEIIISYKFKADFKKSQDRYKSVRIL